MPIQMASGFNVVYIKVLQLIMWFIISCWFDANITTVVLL
jgi:hypothetical protein